VARVRSALAHATHDFFGGSGFQLVHTPIVSASDCEGAGEMFQVRGVRAGGRAAAGRGSALRSHSPCTHAAHRLYCVRKTTVTTHAPPPPHTHTPPPAVSPNKNKQQVTTLLSPIEQAKTNGAAPPKPAEVEQARQLVSAQGAAVKAAKEAAKQGGDAGAKQRAEAAVKELLALKDRLGVRVGGVGGVRGVGWVRGVPWWCGWGCGIQGSRACWGLML